MQKRYYRARRDFLIFSLLVLSKHVTLIYDNLFIFGMYYALYHSALSLHRSLSSDKAVRSEIKISKQEGIIMPRGNGTGPLGQGAKTGRGAGFCAGFSAPGFANAGFGCGRGRGLGFGRGAGFGRGFGGGQGFGRGAGRGFGRGFANWGGAAFDNATAAATPTAEQESDILQKQAEYLEANLQEIRQRLAELKEKKAD
ncbi:MAG TPA: DUF5320 domain-containing protein [Lentisphaeria bacterium]|nr:DUF5320 domain-containing protein [Lentisphaeria bacterium]HQL86019.1 DUF5320 domain-containing protein [Lentisphaeria bacterium]